MITLIGMQFEFNAAGVGKSQPTNFNAEGVGKFQPSGWSAATTLGSQYDLAR